MTICIEAARNVRFSAKVGARGLTMALAIFAGLVSIRTGAAEPRLEVLVDARVETCAVVCRLAGFREYQARGIAAYDRAVDAHFQPFTNHPAVALARKLHRTRGIGYNAPVGLALAADPDTFQPRVKLDPLPAWLDLRWSPASAAEFLGALGRFSAETRAREFFESQQPIHREAVQNLQEGLEPRLDLKWFTRQYAGASGARFVVVAGLLHGQQNYGVEVKLADGLTEVYAVVGTPVFAEGRPLRFPADALARLAVHEFSHSFVNPWVDSMARQLDPPGGKLYKRVAAEMKAQAYGTARVMLYESVVRANTIRYFLDRGDTANARACINTDNSKSFYWTEALAEVLGGPWPEPRLSASKEAVARFFVDWGKAPAKNIEAAKARLEEAERARLARGPQLVKAVPAHGAKDVDPGLPALELHFDREMAGPIAIYGEAPQITGKPAWDAEKKVLTVPVKLEPGRTYQMQLNNPEKPDDGFRSAAGEPLPWRAWTFQVRPGGRK